MPLAALGKQVDSRLTATRVATATSCAHSTQVEAGAGAAETPTCSRGEGAAAEATCPPPALSCARRHGTHPPALPPVWLRTYKRFTAFVSEINPVLQGPQRSVLFPESSLQEACPARKPRGAHAAPSLARALASPGFQSPFPAHPSGEHFCFLRLRPFWIYFKKPQSHRRATYPTPNSSVNSPNAEEKRRNSSH